MSADHVSPERAALNQRSLAERIRRVARSLTILADRVEEGLSMTSHFDHPVRLIADVGEIVLAYEAWRRGEDLP